MLRKMILVIAAMAAISGAVALSSTEASARWGGRGWGYAGVGLATGLIAASAYPYGYGYGYPGYGYYNAGWGGYEDECVLRPRRVWSPWGWRVSYVQVCY